MFISIPHRILLVRDLLWTVEFISSPLNHSYVKDLKNVRVYKRAFKKDLVRFYVRVFKYVLGLPYRYLTQSFVHCSGRLILCMTTDDLLVLRAVDMEAIVATKQWCASLILSIFWPLFYYHESRLTTILEE